MDINTVSYPLICNGYQHSQLSSNLQEYQHSQLFSNLQEYQHRQLSSILQEYQQGHSNTHTWIQLILN